MRKTDHDVRPAALWMKAMILLALASVVAFMVYVLVFKERDRPSGETVAPLPQSQF